jgi:hypothetical protein
MEEGSMEEINIPQLSMDQPVHYRVWVQGAISERWRDWFDTLEIQPGEGDITCLSGVMPDQAALIGFLQRLYSLGYPILRVEAS